MMRLFLSHYLSLTNQSIQNETKGITRLIVSF